MRGPCRTMTSRAESRRARAFTQSRPMTRYHFARNCCAEFIPRALANRRRAVFARLSLSLSLFLARLSASKSADKRTAAAGSFDGARKKSKAFRRRAPRCSSGDKWKRRKYGQRTPRCWRARTATSRCNPNPFVLLFDMLETRLESATEMSSRESRQKFPRGLQFEQRALRLLSSSCVMRFKRVTKCPLLLIILHESVIIVVIYRML